MRRVFQLSLAAAVLTVAIIPAAARADGVKRTAAGATPADITAARDQFRADVGGGVTAGANGSFGGLRREINWDGVPDAISDPNPFPAGTFNVRGVQFDTPGTGFEVSVNPGGPTPERFGNPDLQTFTPQKLFAPVGSTVTDVHFFVPGTATPATTNAFGVAFADVDTAGSAKLEFFDPAGALIDTVVAPPSANGGLSFAGETFTAGERIARVRITSGTKPIAAAEAAGDDIVAMDDFLYAEPLPGQIAFQVAGQRVDEDAGKAELTVTRTGATAGAASVAFATADGSAKAGQDYTAVSGTLSFAAGETSKRVEVPISADSVQEGDETLSLSLANASGAALAAPRAATITIQDRSAPRDASAPKATLARRRGAGLRYLLASDEAGSYRASVTVTKAQARRAGLSKRTLAAIGPRSLQSGGNRLTVKLPARTRTKLHRAAIKPTLTVVARDLAGNQATLRQRVDV
jgi:hypothetical protein